MTDPSAVPTVFEDRRQAGRLLAARLCHLSAQPGLIVLGLPRGGVPVAWEVAHALRAPLDVLPVRKLGTPGQEEYAMGAIAAGVQVIDEAAIHSLDIPPQALEQALQAEARELRRREQAYRAGRAPPALAGCTVVLVDDGLATGATMRAAVLSVRRQAPARVVVAVPVGAASACALLQQQADEVVCLSTPQPFHAVGLWYRDFEQTPDEEVLRLLART